MGRRIAAGVGLSLVFIVALVAGVILHLPTSLARGLLEKHLPGLVSGALPGTVAIGEIEALGPGEIVLHDIALDAPNGQPVARIGRARMEPSWSLLGGLFRGELNLGPIEADPVWVSLAEGEEELALVEAVTPKNDTPSQGKAMIIRLPAIRVDDAIVDPGHGMLPVEVVALEGRVLVAENVRLAWSLGGAQTQLRNGPALQLSGRGGLRVAEELELDADLSGAVDGAHWTFNGGMVAGEVAGTFHLSPTSPEALDPSWRPAVLPEGLYAATLVAGGTMMAPQVELDVSLTRSDGKARIRGSTRAELGRSEVAARLFVEGLQLAWLGPDLPQGVVEAQIEGRLGFADEVGAEVFASLPKTTLNGQSVPALDVYARARHLAKTPSLEASLRGRERPWQAALSHDDKTTEAWLDVVGLPLATLPGVDGGKADVSARASLRGQQLERGQVSLAVRAFSSGTLRVDRLRLRGDAKGPIDEPRRLMSHVDVKALAGTEDLGLRPVALRVNGGLGSAKVEAETPDAPGRWGRVELDARLGLSKTGRVDLDALEVVVRVPAGVPLRLEVDRAWYDTNDQGFGVKGLAVNGIAGKPLRAEGFGSMTGAKTLSLDVPSLKLKDVARVAPVDVPAMSGAVSLSGSARLQGAYVNGEIRGEVRDLRMAGSPPIDGEIEAKLAGRDVDVKADVSTPGLELEVRTRDLRLAGPLDAAASWRRPSGHLRVKANVAELDELVARLQKEKLLVEELPLAVEGAAELDIIYDRERGGQPQGTVAVVLSDFGMQKPGSWSWSNLEVGVSGRLNQTGGTVHLSVDDPKGKWIRGGVRMKRLAPVLWRGDIDALFRLPVDARIDIQPRPMKKIPPIGLDSIGGRLGAKLRLTGSLDDPRLVVDAQARRMRMEEGLRRPHRVDARLEVQRRRAKLVVVAGPRKAPEMLDVELTLTGPIVEALRKPVVASDFRLDGDVKLDQFPLRPIEGITGVMLGGKLDGEVELRDVGGKGGFIEARVRGRELSVAGAEDVEIDLKVDLDGGQAKSELTIARGDNGRLVAKASAPMETGLKPNFSGGQLDVAAEEFELDMLQPVVGPILPVLEGVLDGEFHLRPRGKGVAAKGKLTLSDGRFQVGGIGEVFNDAQATITLSEDGRIVLEKLTAKTFEGRISVKGDAQLDGIALKRADAQITIADPIPLIVSGQRVGDAEGNIELAARMDDDGLRLDVDVPKLRVDLPRTLPSGVQSLEPTEDIKVGVRREGRFVAIPTGPPEEPKSSSSLPILVEVSLGDVEVRRNTQLWAELGGGPRVEVTDRARVGGTIRIERGELELQGRTFQIEPSVVNFDGHPPDNPQIIATAHWDAPDGTRVFADYRGPLKNGELTLRSDPAMSQEAIISLLLFGESGLEDGGDDNGGQAAGAAASVGGSVLTAGLNDAISDLTNLDLQAKVGNRNGATSTDVELRIARDISIGFSHILGITSPSTGPDRNFASVEWRFARKWEIEATVGDAGSAALDLLWRHRYR